MVKWRRTFPDKAYDFSAHDEGLTVGRIYRHFDEIRWQWFFQQSPGRSGIADSKQDAINALMAAYEAWKA